MNGRTEVSVKSDGCAGGYGSDVRRVEHVQAVVTLSSSRRGHVELYLTSPGGTRSTLLAGRRGKLATSYSLLRQLFKSSVSDHSLVWFGVLVALLIPPSKLLYGRPG